MQAAAHLLAAQPLYLILVRFWPKLNKNGVDFCSTTCYCCLNGFTQRSVYKIKIVKRG